MSSCTGSDELKCYINTFVTDYTNGGYSVTKKLIIKNVLQEACKKVHVIKRLHELEETPLLGTFLSIVDIIAAIGKTLFTSFVFWTGCGKETLKSIRLSVYGAYLEEKSFARYLLGVIPFAIPILNYTFFSHNMQLVHYFSKGEEDFLNSADMFCQRVKDTLDKIDCNSKNQAVDLLHM